MMPRRLGMLAVIGTLALPGTQARAHCDTLDGPVVKAGQQALQTGDLSLALVWIQKADEVDLKAAFQKSLAVRKQGAEAKALADTWFLETLVRLHRAGEGAPYTGLKPAGKDLGPAVAATDKAVETGNVEPLIKLLADTAQAGPRERFKELMALKGYKKGDVEAGRRYVAAYVTFVHAVERLYDAAARPGAAHGEAAGEGGAAKPHQHEAH